MIRALGLLFVLAVLALIAQPSAALRYEIHVEYDNGSPVNRAFIQIYEDGNLVDSDYTDSDGIYVAYLNENTYRFKATKDDWTGSSKTRDSYVVITLNRQD
jgi:hypothetical protein